MMEFNRHWFSLKTESYGLTKVDVAESFMNLKVGKNIGLFPVNLFIEGVVGSFRSREG